MPCLSTRLRRGNEDQLASIQFAPTADVTVAEFDEIDRPIEFVLPVTSPDFSLTPVNLDERSWADVRVQRVVLDTDVPIQ
jgi:hypothetical protein